MSIPGSSAPFLLAQQPEPAPYTIDRSLRFNSSDSGYLSRTPASAGSRKTWTWAGWVKRSGETGAAQILFEGLISGTQASNLSFTNSAIRFGTYETSSYTTLIDTTAVFRDFSAWYHIVCQHDSTQSTSSDRLKLYVNGVQLTQLASSTYPSLNSDSFINIAGSHYIGGRAGSFHFSGYLADVHFIDGQALDPTSFGEFDTNGIWQPIEYTGSYGTNGFHLPFDDNSTAAALGTDTSGAGNDWTVHNISTLNGNGNYIASGTITGEGFANSGGINAAFDGDLTTVAYSANSGTERTTFTFGSSISVASSLRFYAAADPNGSPGNTDGFYVNGVNYSALLSPTAAWVTIPESSLSSFQLRNINTIYNAVVFAIEVDGVILLDHSVVSKGNDSLVDVPTNGTETDTGVGGEVRGNYATWNPLGTKTFTLSNGNLDGSFASGTGNVLFGTTGVTAGKWYWEVTPTSGTLAMIGIVDLEVDESLMNYGQAGGLYVYQSTGGLYGYLGGSFSNTAYGSAIAVNDVVGVALDMDNGDIEFYVNGVRLGIANTSTLLGKTIAPGYGNGGGATAVSANFGQRPFAYTAPSGFKALCTANLPAPVVTKPSEYMDVALYTGNGGTQTISGLDFSPDLLWIKSRSAAYSHRLYDSIRGIADALYPDLTDAEGANQGTNENLTAFTSDGFSLGAATGIDAINANSATFVAWTWDAGTTTASNTDGSITSTVRANPSAGFSVVSYSGTISGSPPSPLPTVGHGLGIAPQLVIGKSRDNAGIDTGNWFVWHASAGTGNWLRLNTTGAAGNISGSSGGTMVAPTSTVFSTPYISGSNISGATYVAYCFAPVDGYTVASSYTGNGNADGPFVFTNMRPRWILIKRTDTTSNWTIIDTAREGYNVDNDPLFPNLSNAEGTTDLADILSNGFKLRTTDASVNANTGTYIYFAIAEAAFNYSRAR